MTLVGNDTGGAICQFVLDTDATRIGRLVLTNCDAFDNFPPAPFDTLFKSFSSASAIRGLMAPMRATAVRHSLAGYGMLAAEFDADQTRAWVEPCLSDAGVRRDTAAFARAADPGDLLDVAPGSAASSGRCCWCGATATASSSSTSPAAWATCSPTPDWWRSRAA